MTPGELAQLAAQHLTRTTVSYPEWKKRVDAGRYLPQDGSGTEWGKAFAALAQIQVPETPPPSPTGVQPPVGPLMDRAGSLMLRTGSGTLTTKLHITSSPDYGIGNMRWPYVGASTGVWDLRDCKVENVTANPPRSMDGTGEAGFWVGEKTLGARLEATRCAWMGMWLGAAASGSRFTDVNLHDNPLVGLYIEHPAEDVVFERCRFGFPDNGIVGQGSSINAEWWYADPVYGHLFPYQGKAGSRNITFKGCDIYCPPPPTDWRNYQVAGAFLDAGTYGYRFEDCRFVGPGHALGLPNKRIVQTATNTVTNCVFENAGNRVYYHDNVIG